MRVKVSAGLATVAALFALWITAGGDIGGGTPTPTPTPTVVGAPANTGAPVVAGIADIGTYVAPQFMARTRGTWTESPTEFTYQWEDCNSLGQNCVNGSGKAYGPGADGSSCVNDAMEDACSYNLLAGHAEEPCPYAAGSTGACTVRLLLTARNEAGSSAPVVTAKSAPIAASSPAWPNYSNTGYQNAPGYTGTPGVADESELETASSDSSTCPLTFQSNHTYTGCHYNELPSIGSAGNHLSNVHFVGSLFEESTNSWGFLMYCDANCTFDYVTIKPGQVDAPDLPGHGVDFVTSAYGEICACGIGAFNSTGKGIAFTNSDIWGWSTGIILGPNSVSTPILFEDNWLHDQSNCNDYYPDPCSTHADGIGMVDTGGTSSYVTINHNNMPFVQSNTNNIAFQSGTYSHLTITNNVFSGDGYTIAIWSTSTNVRFEDNLWTNYAQQLFGPVYPQSFWAGGTNTWDDNRFAWDPTGVGPLYPDGQSTGSPITADDDQKCWTPSGLSTSDYGGGTC